MSKRDILVSKAKQKDLSPIERELKKDEIRELDGWSNDQQRVAEERWAQDHAEKSIAWTLTRALHGSR